jgi:hypothetical protein
MHIRRGALGWGVFLILAGSIPLLVRAGVLTDSQVSDLWTLWPMILIGLGIGLLLSRTRFAFVGGLVVAATFGLIVGGLLSGGFSANAGACGSNQGATPFDEQTGTLTAGAASIDVRLDCGDVAIATAPGVDWTVAGDAKDGRGPRIDAGPDQLSIDPTEGGGLFGIFSTRSTPTPAPPRWISPGPGWAWSTSVSTPGRPRWTSGPSRRSGSSRWSSPPGRPASRCRTSR